MYLGKYIVWLHSLTSFQSWFYIRILDFFLEKILNVKKVHCIHFLMPHILLASLWIIGYSNIKIKNMCSSISCIHRKQILDSQGVYRKKDKEQIKRFKIPDCSCALYMIAWSIMSSHDFTLNYLCNVIGIYVPGRHNL